MCNYLLLCHGSQIEFSSFDVPESSEIIYWGAPGYLLPVDVAWTAVAQIRKDPTNLESINRFFNHLPPLSDRILTGGQSYRPDLSLRGADDILCFFINLSTNQYALLGDRWVSRLSRIIQFDSTFVLHLLCCSGQEENPDLTVLNGLEQTNPENLIPS